MQVGEAAGGPLAAARQKAYVSWMSSNSSAAVSFRTYASAFALILRGLLLRPART